MYKIISFFLVGFAFTVDADHLIFSRITITPDEAEMLAIYNPTPTAIDLDDYYISDAELSDITAQTDGKHYYHLPSCVISGEDNYWSGSNRDFIARFPSTSIQPNQTLYIGLSDAQDFENYYGYPANLILQTDMQDAITGIPSMATSSDVLNDNYEVLILFYWDGNSPTVKDVDYLFWGDTQALPLYGINKTGVSGYLADTDFSIQENNTLDASQDGETYIRLSSEEIGETTSGGNGITNHDETSEVFKNSWEIITHPEIIFGCTIETDPEYNPEAAVDDGSCLTTHTIQEITSQDACAHIESNNYPATLLGLLIGYDDIRPNNGPQVMPVQDENGYSIDILVWDEFDVPTSSIGYMVDPSNLTEYVILVDGIVGAYECGWQFTITSPEDVTVYDEYNPEGVFTEDQSIIKATIEPAPYVIIPSIGERLDFEYSFPSNSRVVIRIFDLNGRFITSIVDRFFESAGIVQRATDKADWDGKNHLSQIVSPGTYLIHIEATNYLTGESSIDIAPIVVGVNY